MTKHEAPALKMQIENGRLVPVAQWDQERIMSYRNGSVVSVRVTQEKNRKLERKYWAILHEVVDKCGIRQRTAEDLHKAIRLKLGVVDAYWTLDGKLRVDVKSTVGMEEPEYRQFFEDAMALLHKETGIDPLTLQSESADVGDEDNPQSSELPSSDEGSGEAAPSPSTAADLPPADEAGMEEGDNPGQVTTEQAAPSSTPIPADWLKSFARMIVAATGVDAQFVVNTSKGAFVGGLSVDQRERARAIVNYALQICRNEIDRDDALEIIAGKALCEVGDLR